MGRKKVDRSNKVMLPVTELVFMDIDERKLNIVGGLCQRMIEAAGLPCKTEIVLIITSTNSGV